MKNKSYIVTALSVFSFMIFLYTCSFFFIIQISSSVTPGIYLKKSVPETIAIGQMVLFEIPPEIKSFMIDRQWIPSHVTYYLMKPVAAKSGDHISVTDKGIFINKIFKGSVKNFDQQGLILPQYHFNGDLKQNTYFLLASAHNSFDSRYFGPIHKRSIISIVEPFILFP
jgi:conjugative transfer signal peptidase TraF